MYLILNNQDVATLLVELSIYMFVSYKVFY